VLAPRDQHSYAGHRVTTDAPLILAETGPQQFNLSGTPVDCVRIALTELFPAIDLVLAGINRGGNLGADIFSSGTVGAAREAAILGKPAIAISQYVKKGMAIDWDWSRELARPMIEQLISESCPPKSYWNLNLPHTETGDQPPVVRCVPDHAPLDIRFDRERDQFRYSGSYRSRPRTPGRDVDHCFRGAITVSCLSL
jgi:5'-nucleotidase